MEIEHFVQRFALCDVWQVNNYPAGHTCQIWESERSDSVVSEPVIHCCTMYDTSRSKSLIFFVVLARNKESRMRI